MKLLLYGIRNFGNLGMILRSAEYFGVEECYVYNDHNREGGQIRENLLEYPRGLRRRLVRVSGGGITRMKVRVLRDVGEFMAEYTGRLVATSLGVESRGIGEVTLRRDDCVLLGGEALGLPRRVMMGCGVRIKIGGGGVTGSLNVAMAAAIVFYEYMRQGCSAGV